MNHPEEVPMPMEPTLPNTPGSNTEDMSDKVLRNGRKILSLVALVTSFVALYKKFFGKK